MAKTKTSRSFDEIQTLVRNAIRATLPVGTYTWINDCYDDHAVFAVETPSQGTAYFRVDYTIDDSGLVSLGQSEEVRKRTEWETVVHASVFQFSAPVLQADGTYLIDGKIFECGDYPDKGFSLTEVEADAAIEAFEAAPVEIEHLPNIFTTEDKFNIGSLEKIYRSGKEIFGTFRFSAWVGTALKGVKPKISLGWQSFPKKITEASLVLNPRIVDAKLNAAFSQVRISRTGASMNAIQRFLASIRGLSEEDIAKFNQLPETTPTSPPTPDLTAAIDAAVAKAVTPLIEQFKAVAPTPATDIQTEAAIANFEEFLKASKRVAPAQFPTFKEMYRSALTDDGGGAIQFAQGRPFEGTRTQHIRDLVNGMPELSLTTEGIKGVKMFEFAAEDDGGELQLTVDPKQIVTGKKTKKEA